MALTQQEKAQRDLDAASKAVEKAGAKRESTRAKAEAAADAADAAAAEHDEALRLQQYAASHPLLATVVPAASADGPASIG